MRAKASRKTAPFYDVICLAFFRLDRSLLYTKFVPTTNPSELSPNESAITRMGGGKPPDLLCTNSVSQCGVQHQPVRAEARCEYRWCLPQAVTQIGQGRQSIATACAWRCMPQDSTKPRAQLCRVGDSSLRHDALWPVTGSV